MARKNVVARRAPVQNLRKLLGDFSDARSLLAVVTCALETRHDDTTDEAIALRFVLKNFDNVYDAFDTAVAAAEGG